MCYRFVLCFGLVVLCGLVVFLVWVVQGDFGGALGFVVGLLGFGLVGCCAMLSCVVFVLLVWFGWFVLVLVWV